jgi:hypothetical protein
MPKKLTYTVCVTFDLEGTWEHFEHIPYEAFVKQMEIRLNELKREKYLDAFDLVDITDFGDYDEDND